ARLQELRRLRFLEGLGLTEKVGTRTWRLLPGMEPALRQAQRAGDIIASRARHLAHLSDPRLPVVVTTIEAGTRVTGRVVGTGLADELRDRRYLLLEGTDGRLHYISQPAAVEQARGAGHLRVGDVVTLSGDQIERGGRQMVETRVDVHTAKPAATGRPTGRQGRVPASSALPLLKTVERTLGRAVPIVPPAEGLVYRGRLL